MLNKRKLFIFIFFILILSLLFPQKRKHSEGSAQIEQIYFESHIFPSDSLYKCFLSFKIPYSNMLFVRNNGKFKSGVSITYELFNGDKFISRIFDQKSILVNDYETTNSHNRFLEGVVSFKLMRGEYRVLPSILLENTDIEISNKPFKLLLDSLHLNKPLVVSNKSECKYSNFKLANLGNAIPFSPNKYDLLIPIYSEIVLPLKIKLEQGRNTVIDTSLSSFELLNNELLDCDNEIVLSDINNRENPIKYFRIKYANKKLVEGSAKLFLTGGSYKREFEMDVIWLEKPKSLFNIEDAIDALDIIGFGHVADSISSLSDDEEYEALFNFWKRFDDDKTTSYNEVFREFYSRIDFINKEFNTLGENDGLETDRGKTYLLLGKPDKIERNYSEVYNVLEIWTYGSLNEKIYFSDKTGTGKFKRIK